MKVALDLQLSVGTPTGIGEYAMGLERTLPACGVEVIPLYAEWFNPWRFDRRVIWDQILLPRAANKTRADLLHCASGTMPLLAPLLTVVTVHDVAWFRVQAHARPYARWYFGKFSLARYRSAERIFVDSAFSKTELLQFLDVPPERIVVAYPGVADDIASVVRRPAPDERFILAVGTVERRKNLATVIRALAELPADTRLVSVGPPTPYLAECSALAHSLGVSQRVEFRGYVPREQLLDLYERATVAVVPSTYEGFGYAAAQALCAGVPLIASNAASLPEVVGDAAPLLPPEDIAAWRDALRVLLEKRGTGATSQTNAADMEEGRTAAMKRFSWDATIGVVVAAYHAALT